MKDGVDISALLLDLASHTEGLRVALNGIIARYQLHPSVVLSLLARFTAGYIHLTQKMYNQTHDDVVVEEDFHNMLVASLTSLDMSDVNLEMEKIEKQVLN